VSLSAALEDYLRLRRSLGYKLKRSGELLAGFVAYAEAAGADHVRTELAVSWALLAANPDSRWRADRLAAVRGFARYLHAIYPGHEVPPAGLIPRGRGRPAPYLYSQNEVTALMAAARRLRTPLRAATLEAVVGLLAVSGLRVGEVIHLDNDDADFDGAALIVRGSKGGKSRVVPLDHSTVEALRSYAAVRDRWFPQARSDSFFVSTVGYRLRSGNLRDAFADVVALAGLPARARRTRASPGGLPPQLRRPDPDRLAPGRARCRAPAADALDLPGSCEPGLDVLVPLGVPGTAGGSGRTSRKLERQVAAMTALAPALQAFFTVRLAAQRNASPHTVAAYRDAFRLLLGYVQETTGIPPAKLSLEDLDAPLISAFLDHLESRRGVTIKTRNSRLAAVHSLFRFAALRHPEHAELIQRVLAIPAKRAPRQLISHLTTPEIEALLAAPDLASRTGRRDQALLLVAIQTGLRVSELTGLRRQDVILGTGAHVSCTGKGRKQRSTPLSRDTAKLLHAWMSESSGSPDGPLFPGPRGESLTRDAISRIVARHAAVAARSCPSIATKTVSPHVLRHSCAMQLLAGGVDVAVIALWLGHESVRTTDIYQHADLALKEQALARTARPRTPRGRYRPPDRLLAFLEAL
jgi:site-specific recombinase XerD